MFYIIYKVTNEINGKFYIGTHKTKDINDNYMGSGKYLKYAQEKHGIENFTKEILHVFDNPQDMYSKEAEIVNEDFLTEENTYNLKLGGFGGFDYINDSGKNIYGKNGTLGYGRENLLTGGELKEKLVAENRFEEYKENLSKSLKKVYENNDSGFKGLKHTEEAKRKIGESVSRKQKGKGNSQYGTRWIYSIKLKKSKKIKNEEPLPNGWCEGRKIKF